MTTTLSDADALLQASATPYSSNGPILVTTLAETEPVQPVPGGAIQTLNTEVPQVNVATVDTAPVGGGIDTKALLWVGAGIGTAWLLSRSDRSVSGPKNQNWLVPALILAAGAGWYFFGDKLTSAPPATGDTTPSGGAASGAEAQRQALQVQYNGQPKQLAVIATADAETLRRWSLVYGMWVRNATTAELYGVGVDGITPARWDDSLGKWWENFAAANHF